MSNYKYFKQKEYLFKYFTIVSTNRIRKCIKCGCDIIPYEPYIRATQISGGKFIAGGNFCMKCSMEYLNDIKFFTLP